MDNILILFLSQLAVQAPALLVYLVGMILALVFLRRYPGPSTLTLIATGLLLATSILQSFLFVYLVQARADLGWTDARLSWMLSANALVGSATRAVAFGLMLTAVFIGRRLGQQTGPNQALQLTGPALPQSQEHGITSRPGS